MNPNWVKKYALYKMGVENIAMKFNNLGADIKLIDDNSMQGENNA